MRESAQSFTGSYLQRPEAWSFTAVIILNYASNHCPQIRSIKETRPQNVSEGQSESIISSF